VNLIVSVTESVGALLASRRGVATTSVYNLVLPCLSLGMPLVSITRLPNAACVDAQVNLIVSVTESVGALLASRRGVATTSVYNLVLPCLSLGMPLVSITRLPNAACVDAQVNLIVSVTESVGALLAS